MNMMAVKLTASNDEGRPLFALGRSLAVGGADCAAPHER